MNRSKLHLKMPKQTMRRKLFLYTFAMAILLLALLATADSARQIPHSERRTF